MVIDFTSEEFKKLKGKLIIEFNQYLKESDLEKYHNVIKVFLNFLENDEDGFFKQLRNLTFKKMNFIDDKAYEEYKKIYENLEHMKTNISNKEKIIAKKFIINNFVIIVYSYSYLAWYSTSRSETYHGFYSSIISNIDKEILVFDSHILHTILNISRIISKHHYDDYILNNQKLVEFMNNVETVTAEVKEIQEKCEMYRTDIQEIEKSLKEQRQEFNFIRLADAFQKMQKDKQTELEEEQKYNSRLMGGIGLLLVVKLLYALFGSFSGFDAKFAFISISSIFLIAVLIYFFRISLINIKSIKSQILQLDLRLSLCQFIHNYAEDSEKMRKDNMKDSLDRFESIIFSPIVANEEQIPATFDNLDQFIKMMNIANGGKGETK